MRPAIALLLLMTGLGCTHAGRVSNAHASPTKVEPAKVDLGDGLVWVAQKKAEKFENCRESRSYYRFNGEHDPERARKLNELVAQAIEPEYTCSKNGPGSDDPCRAPYRFDDTIESFRKLGDYLFFKVRSTYYMCGAHDNYGYKAHVLDLARATTVDIGAFLNPGGQELLDSLAKQKVDPKRESPLKISMSQVQPNGKGFAVQFDPYEVASFAEGAPSYSFTAEEAAQIFRSTPETRALFGIN